MEEEQTNEPTKEQIKLTVKAAGQDLKLRELDLELLNTDYRRKRAEVEQDIENLKEFIRNNK